MRRPGLRALLWTALLLAALVGAAAGPASAATGDLTQKPGTDGCVSDDGSGGSCADGNALDGANSVAVSPDGRNVYATAPIAIRNDDGAVAVFDRNGSTGALNQKAGAAGCISERGENDCTDGLALIGASSIVVSPDGENVYATAGGSDAVVVLDRDSTTGALSQKPGQAGCISDDGTPEDSDDNPALLCTDGVALEGPTAIAISADGKSVYVTARHSDAVAVFDRNTSTGELSQKAGTAGCISNTVAGCAGGAAVDDTTSVAISPDGKSAYVGSHGATNAVAIFDRNTSTGALSQKPGNLACFSEEDIGAGCADGFALLAPGSIAVSADGASVYVASTNSNAIVFFERSTQDGTLSYTSGDCISDDGSGGGCAPGRGLTGPQAVAVAPDDQSVYAASWTSNGVAAFSRHEETGELEQKAGSRGCISDTGEDGCGQGVALDEARGVAVSPGNESVYVASGVSDAIAVFDREVDPTTPPPPPPLPADTTVEGFVTAKKKQRQKRKRVVVKVKVRAGEKLRARAKGKVKLGKKSYKLKRRSKSVDEGKKRTLKLKPNKGRQAKKIARALKRGKRAKTKLTVKLIDGAGNTKSTKLKVRLKR